ncbi:MULTISPECIES: hypothetical protein [unclassified Paracoccus (in: a-proteobacteria)]|uniref:hypothetical protein n=1 Tax=unclassified Paracoccus (in: a-proteobacteria) TaxID=2688777 RepID=UPI001FFE065B|nr:MULTISPECIES: hypothetical protein [unclassified Paracoccus (in: a-proteobacteria)]
MTMETTALTGAGLTGVPGAAVEGRANIFEMTQAAEEAVLRPKDCGAWSHELRAALAARIAVQNDEHALAERYAAGAGGFAPLAGPSQDGAAEGLAAVLAFMDKVAADTRNVASTDIAGLQAAGILDADIVRLCELNAFLAYQLRVVAGLRLMKGVFA